MMIKFNHSLQTMDPKYKIELSRKLSNGEWKVRTVKQNDKKQRKNMQIYDVFCVVYDGCGRIVNNWCVDIVFNKNKIFMYES